MVLRQAACVLALCVVAVGVASATPKETHKLGVQAIEAGRWADAERFFRAAIAERSQEKFNRLLKTAYLPHYYLGVALAEQGYCKSALTSLAESSTQAQIQKSDLAKDLNRRREDCQNHLRQVDVAKTEVEQILIQVGEASASLSSLSKTPELSPLWKQGDPSFDSRQKSAARKLTQARQHLDARDTGNDLAQLKQAKSLADSALSELNATLTDARRRLGTLNAAAAAALEHLEEVEQSARRVLRSISDLAPYPKRLGSRVAAVNRILRETRHNKSGSSAQHLTTLASDLTAALKALRSAASRPPKELVQAVEAFLEGSYEDALTLLDVPSLVDNSRTKPHVCLIRAASNHSLWVLAGEQDDTLRNLAADAIIACLDDSAPAVGDEPAEPTILEPSLPLSLKFFSPRFVEFHDATLAAYAQSIGLAATGEENQLATDEDLAADFDADGSPPVLAEGAEAQADG